MIESAHDTIDFEPLPTEDSDDSTAKDPEQITRPTTQYTSASFRQSYKLLRSEGGLFRGFSMYFVNRLAVAFVALMFQATIGFFPFAFYAVLSSVLCAQLSLGWTFIVISKPSPKFWFRRIPSVKLWKKIAAPTAIHALATQIATAAPVYLSLALGLTQDPNTIINLPAHQQRSNGLKSLAVIALGLALAFLLVIPTTVALTRVQASLLSDSEETIVPFDRTFGGKVVPEIIGGSGMIGILEAWRSFDLAARVRLIKAYGKVIAMVIALIAFFATLLFVESIISIDFNKVIVPDDRNL